MPGPLATGAVAAVVAGAGDIAGVEIGAMAFAGVAIGAVVVGVVAAEALGLALGTTGAAATGVAPYQSFTPL